MIPPTSKLLLLMPDFLPAPATCSPLSIFIPVQSSGLRIIYRLMTPKFATPSLYLPCWSTKLYLATSWTLAPECLSLPQRVFSTSIKWQCHFFIRLKNSNSSFLATSHIESIGFVLKICAGHLFSIAPSLALPLGCFHGLCVYCLCLGHLQFPHATQ